MTLRLTFEFNAAKFIQSLVFFSKHGVTDLTKLKAAKLLYFADKEHLVKYGRPIIGDVYYALPLGPLPSQADDFLDEVEAAHLTGPTTPEQEEFFAYLDVAADYWPRFVARGHENFRVFSKSDLAVLTHIADAYGKLHWKKLVDLTHEEAAWKTANLERPKPSGRALMPYESFFDGEDKSMLRLAEEEQAERSVAAFIRRPA